MRKLLWLVVLAGAFYGHSRWAFSDAGVLRWIEKHDAAVVDQQEGVCDAFARDAVITIRAVHARGEWQVDGGRNEVCGYLKSSNAYVRLLKPDVETHTELVSIQRSGFPWMQASVTVRKATEFRLGTKTLAETAETSYVLRRTIKGMQITGMNTRSQGQFPR